MGNPWRGEEIHTLQRTPSIAISIVWRVRGDDFRVCCSSRLGARYLPRAQVSQQPLTRRQNAPPRAGKCFAAREASNPRARCILRPRRTVAPPFGSSYIGCDADMHLGADVLYDP
jgi:hypothetical protein